MKALTLKGGLAAFICAFCYLFGLVFYLLVFPEALAPEKAVATFLAHNTLYEVWIIMVYLVFGISMLYLSFEFNRYYPSFRFGYALAIVWATMLLASGSIALIGIRAVADKPMGQEAASLWEVLGIIQNALGGGIELVAGLWCAFTAKEIYKGQKLLGLMGFITAALGVLTIFSVFKDWVAVFGLLQLCFFVVLGFWLIKGTNAAKTESHFKLGQRPFQKGIL